MASGRTFFRRLSAASVERPSQQGPMMRRIDRRQILASTSALALLAATGVKAQAPAGAAIPADTEWRNYGNDLAASHYAPLNQINAANFNNLEIAWRFK